MPHFTFISRFVVFEITAHLGFSIKTQALHMLHSDCLCCFDL